MKIILPKFEQILSSQKRVSLDLREILLRYPALGAVFSLLVIFTTFGIIQPLFLKVTNLTNLLTFTSELGIISIGVSFLMISGEFDLSVGSIYGFSAWLFMIVANATNSIFGLIISIIFGGLIGFINGFISFKFKLPSFIVTLGMKMILAGMLNGLMAGRSLVYKSDNYIPKIFTSKLIYGIRPTHFLFIFLALLFHGILTQTRYGNWVMASGGNKEVARNMGVNPHEVKIKNFIISGMLAALVGVLVASRYSLVNPTFGLEKELQAIAASVIGGCALHGGFGSIIGAAISAITVGMIKIGLAMSGLSGYFYETFIGIFLVFAAIINTWIRKF